MRTSLQARPDLSRRYIEGMAWGLEGLFGTSLPELPEGYFDALCAVLINVLECERRLGLFNLFWLAHSTDAADVIQGLFSQPGIKIDIKYQIYPLLQGSYRNARNRAWTRFKSQKGDAIRHNLGSRFNSKWGSVSTRAEHRWPTSSWMKRNILLEYVGDAKLKKIGRSIAIYRLRLEEGHTTPPTSRSRRPS